MDRVSRWWLVGIQVTAAGAAIAVQALGMEASLYLGGSVSLVGIMVAVWHRLENLTLAFRRWIVAAATSLLLLLITGFLREIGELTGIILWPIPALLGLGVFALRKRLPARARIVGEIRALLDPQGVGDGSKDQANLEVEGPLVTLMMPPSPPWLKALSILFVAFSVGFLLWSIVTFMQLGAHLFPSFKSGGELHGVKGEDYLEQTVLNLTNSVKGMTQVRAEAHARAYLGKPYIVSGRIGDISKLSPLDDGGYLVLESRLGEPSVLIYVDQAMLAYLSGLEQGHSVTIDGVVSSIRASSVTIRARRLLSKPDLNSAAIVLPAVVPEGGGANRGPEGSQLVSGRAVGWKPENGTYQIEEPLEELLSRAQGLSTLRATELLSPLLGKWYAVEGVVDDVYPLSDGLVAVFLRVSGGEPRVRLLLDQSSFAPISHLEPGYRLSARGRIAEIDRTRLLLDEVVPLNIHAPDRADP